MATPIESIRETNHEGIGTEKTAISLAQCPPMQTCRMIWAGFSTIGRNYCYVRSNPAFSHVTICTAGRAEVLSDGRWTPFSESMAALSPARALHGARSLPGESCSICWVGYDEAPGSTPLLAAEAPVFTRLDHRPVLWAVQGLCHEVLGTAHPAIMHQMVTVLDSLVKRITASGQIDERLRRLWDCVDSDLAYPWTVDECAARLHMSAVHLRRLCRRELGHSPQDRLTLLRMRRAAQLLHTGSDPVKMIASKVGYENEFAFSTAFKRIMGMTPTDFRASNSRST